MKTGSADLFDLPVIITPDHPLSVGHSLRLGTTSPFALKPVRLSDRWMKACKSRTPSSNWEGYTTHITSDQGEHERDELMLIDCKAGKTRLIELVVHESSHFVDNMFERTGVKACTELRAYYHDWVVGKIIANFKL